MADFLQPLEIRQYPLPVEIEPGAMLVKVEIAGICGTDVHLWKGQLPIPRPIIMGHETVGIIDRLGEGLETDWTGVPLREGDRVTWSAGMLCGSCYHCAVIRQPTRCWNRRAYGISFNCDEPPHFSGGYAEYVYLRAGTAIFKLSDVASEAVTGAGCALVTAIHGLERMGIRWGDNVVIQGSGPVGLAALAVARSAGASTTIVIGGPAARLKLAKAFGADHTIHVEEIPDASVRLDLIMSFTKGHGADAVIECVGSPVVVPEGFEMCRDGGKYLVLGHYGDAGGTQINPHVITRKQLTVYGSWASEPRHMAAAIEFLRKQGERFPFDQLISHRFPLDRAFEALQTTPKWVSTKSVIAP
ncbi:MAG TPA: zinc-binding dehydrogenase [Pyrinomonadaceae bacterium]|nr:zinc-binding dehydrogenase [Pyrinomonadaceae bacterium]